MKRNADIGLFTNSLKIIVKIIAGIAGLFVLEALFFLWVSNQPSDTSRHDAILVFAGSNNRVARAYQLAAQGVAPVLIISPANRRSIGYFEKRFGLPGRATYILEEQADTTFMNAFYSAKLIEEHQLKSILLVTSDYHMPRSFLLLRLATLTAGCHMGIHKIDTRSLAPTTWRVRMTRLKLTYNEMVQLWGSLIEAGFYFLGAPSAWLKKGSSGVSRWLREVLLFDVGCVDC